MRFPFRIAQATLILAALLCPFVGAQPPATTSNIPTEEWRARRRAELTDPARLFERGGPRICRGDYLGAIRIPIGGIGTGAIHMDGEGRRAAWQLWRNFTDFTLPHSVFAVRAQRSGDKAVVRALQTVAEGPLPAMASLSFCGEYPFGWYDFDDPELPVQVRLEAFSPLIPLNAKDSAIPCAIYNVTVENSGEQPVDVSLLATQQNAAGLIETMPPTATADPGQRVEVREPERWAVEGRSSQQYGGNANRILRTNDATMLHMTGKYPKGSPEYGEMVLTVLDPRAHATASWRDLASLCEPFVDSGRISGPDQAGPSSDGQTLDGALATPFSLAPGEKRTICFFLTWYFPNIPMELDEKCPKWDHDGYVYARWYPDGLSVAKDVLARLDELTAHTRRYHDSLYASNLPYWLIDRISSQVAILASATCFWANDGHFGCWEGCSWTYGSCAGNATHVWGYAHALPRLFPSLGRTMREQEYAEQHDSGMLPVRLGMLRPFQAFDGQCHSILASYLGHKLNADGEWLAHHWPKIEHSMNYLIAGWDPDEDGMLTGPQHGMDSSHSGTSSWMGSMYLAALAAAEQMARLQGDEEVAARYAKILKVGAKNQDERLFNGEYYIQIPDQKLLRDYMTGCYTDQLLGQWWANLLDLGWIYPREHVRSAMKALFEHNFRTDFYGFEQSPRKFVADHEAAMVQCSWPRGGRPAPENTMLHADEVKVGISYPVAALALSAGLPTESLAIVRANYDRHDGLLRTGLDDTPWSGLGISGNPFGDDCAGKFYVRALSTWSMLLACQGQIYDGPTGLLGFVPAWQPDDHLSFFTAAEGWGRFSQTRDGAQQRDRVELDWGTLRLNELVFELVDGKQPAEVEIRVSGEIIRAEHSREAGRLHIMLASDVTLDAGDVLEVTINTK